MRTGKIARLPRHLRLQLNRRLADGECGRALLAWLNALPEVRSILQRDFDSREINEPNLTDWKQGGYREWLTQLEIVEQISDFAANAGELDRAAHGCISDQIATMLAARYAAIFAGWDGENVEELQRKIGALRNLCRDVAELRRGDHKVARIRIEQARLDRERDKTDEEIYQYFRQWTALPKVRQSLPSGAPPHDSDPLHSLFTEDQPEPSTPSPAPENLTHLNQT